MAMSPDVARIAISYLTPDQLKPFFERQKLDPNMKFEHNAQTCSPGEFRRIYRKFPNCAITHVVFKGARSDPYFKIMMDSELITIEFKKIVDSGAKHAMKVAEQNKDEMEAVRLVEEFEAMEGLRVYEEFMKSDEGKEWIRAKGKGVFNDEKVAEMRKGFDRYNRFIAMEEVIKKKGKNYDDEPCIVRIYNLLKGAGKAEKGKKKGEQEFEWYYKEVNNKVANECAKIAISMTKNDVDMCGSVAIIPLNEFREAVIWRRNKLEESREEYDVDKNLRGIDYSNLKSVGFVDCEITGIPKCVMGDKVRKMKVLNCVGLVPKDAFQGLEKCVGLKSLELQNVPSKIEIDEAMPNVRKLVVSGKFYNVSFVKKFFNLRYLKLSGFLNGIVVLPLTLEILDLSDVVMADSFSLDDMKLCSNLKTIDLSRTNVSNLKMIQGLKKLEKIVLNCCIMLKEFPALSCKGLKSLIWEYSVVKNLSNLKGMDELRELNLNECVITTLDDVVECGNLEVLNLSGYKGRDFHKLNRLIGLRDLNMSRCRFVSLSFLDSLSRLERLGLVCGLGIRDWAPLLGLLNLKYLDVSKCSNYPGDDFIRKDIVVINKVEVYPKDDDVHLLLR